jgi:hypothetical protein
MRRKALMFVLAIGAVAGFASGIFGCRYHGAERRQAFEDHVADVCTRAAERTRDHRPDSEKMP